MNWIQKRKLIKLGVKAGDAEREFRIQAEYCGVLGQSEKEYRSSYYTDKLHDEVLKRIRLEIKMKCLRDRFFAFSKALDEINGV